MTEDQTCPVQVQAITSRSGDYWVIVPHETAEVGIINEMGYRVFQACDGSHSCTEIAEQLAAETGADVNRVLKDVMSFVTRLIEVGLLHGGRPQK